MAETEVCNMALGRFGGKRINDYNDSSENNVPAIYCRLFYDQVRRALLRSHWWRFARARATLSQTTAPAFQWTYAYLLPVDFLRMIDVHDNSDNATGSAVETYQLEGNVLMMDSSSCQLRYIRDVTLVGEWDPLFTEVMILELARKLVLVLSQDLKMKKDIDEELYVRMKTVKAMDRNEQLHIGRDDLKTWVDGRLTNIA
jgi:hypothetical protein